MISKAEHLKALGSLQKSAFAARVDDLNALRAEFGPQVEEVVQENRARKLKAAWQKIAKDHGRNDIQGMKDTLWQWVLEEGIEYDFEDIPDGTQFRVTRCPLAEMARELDAEDWGYICFCADDPAMVAGFNPQMGFRRTKTLMEGHDCCDHFYFMQE